MKSQKNKGIARFLLNYILCMAGAVVLIGYEPIKKIIDFNGIFSNGLAAAAIPGLKLFGIEAQAQEDTIYVPGYALKILFGCNGLEAFIIYGAAVLSFPASWKMKLYGLAGGLLALQILNYVRIVLLGVAGTFMPDYFELFHIYIAQGLMIAASLVTFIFWINHVSNS
jgi:exosortase/archaeosortase family protein